jgi:hypothetical protein
MLEAATKKMMHNPTVRLRERAADREGESFRSDLLADALMELFELEPVSEPGRPRMSSAPAARARTADATTEDLSDHDVTGVG